MWTWFDPAVLDFPVSCGKGHLGSGSQVQELPTGSESVGSPLLSGGFISFISTVLIYTLASLRVMHSAIQSTSRVSAMQSSHACMGTFRKRFWSLSWVAFTSHRRGTIHGGGIHSSTSTMTSLSSKEIHIVARIERCRSVDHYIRRTVLCYYKFTIFWFWKTWTECFLQSIGLQTKGWRRGEGLW